MQCELRSTEIYRVENGISPLTEEVSDLSHHVRPSKKPIPMMNVVSTIASFPEVSTVIRLFGVFQS